MVFSDEATGAGITLKEDDSKGQQSCVQAPQHALDSN